MSQMPRLRTGLWAHHHAVPIPTGTLVGGLLRW